MRKGKTPDPILSTPGLLYITALLFTLHPMKTQHKQLYQGLSTAVAMVMVSAFEP